MSFMIDIPDLRRFRWGCPCVNAGNNRCYSDGNDDTELVTFTATTTDPYFLRVGSVYSSAQALVRPLDADTKYRLEIEYTGP